MSIFSTSEEAILVSRSHESEIAAIYGSNPLLAHIGRKKAGGRQHDYSIDLGGANVSPSYANGQAVSAPGGARGATALPRELFSFGKVLGPAERSGMGKENARIDLFAKEEYRARMGGAQRLERLIVGGRGFGAIGYVASYTGTTGTVTMTLANRRDARFFKKDMVIELADDEATGGPRTGYVTLTKVAANTGVLTGTCGGSADLSAGATAVGAAIAPKGTFVSGVRVVPTGLCGLISRTAGDLANFDGISDRSEDLVMLAGNYVELGSMSPLDAINSMLDEVGMYSDETDLVLLPTDKYRQLSDDLGANKRETTASGRFPNSVINTKAISIIGRNGNEVKIVGTDNLDPRDAFALSTKYLDLVSPQPVPFTPADGERGWHDRKAAGADEKELVLVATATMICTNFAAQCRGRFNA